jgi:hypothetical protein
MKSRLVVRLGIGGIVFDHELQTDIAGSAANQYRHSGHCRFTKPGAVPTARR